jgi:hypothetical protein
MAATITDLANGSSTSTSSTITTGATVTATAADGDWLVVLITAANNTGIPTVSSVTDGAGNSYTERLDVSISIIPGSVGGPAAIYTAQVTSDITNGQITATLSGNALGRVIQVYRVRPGSGETVSYVSAASGSSSASTSHSTSVSVTNGDTIFCHACIATDSTWTGDSDTTNGSWSALIARIADLGSTGASTQSQYKTVTGTGTQDWAVTSGSSAYGVAQYVILRSSATNREIDADPGSYAVTGTAASLEHGWEVAAAAGSYAVTGVDATLNYGLTIAAGVGSYVVTGVNASLEHGWAFDAGAGSYAVTGSDVTLTRSAAKTIAAAAGSYALTGTTALLQHFTEAEVSSGGMPLKFYAPRVHNYVEVTPAIQAAAYAANDVVFIATEVPNATWRTTPGGEEMICESIAILDKDDNAAANWTFYFGRSAFTLGTINDVVNISDADADLITSHYTMASSSFADLANSKLGFAGKLGLSVMPATGSKSVYIAATTAGTPTFTTTSSITLKLHFIS